MTRGVGAVEVEGGCDEAVEGTGGGGISLGLGASLGTSFTGEGRPESLKNREKLAVAGVASMVGGATETRKSGARDLERDWARQSIMSGARERERDLLIARQSIAEL